MDELKLRAASDRREESQSAQLTRELVEKAGIAGSENHHFDAIPPHIRKKLRKHARNVARRAVCAKAVLA